jgi:hypothetical protein
MVRLPALLYVSHPSRTRHTDLIRDSGTSVPSPQPNNSTTLSTNGTNKVP